MGLRYKRPIKFVGIDSFHRAIFKECELKNFYGCTDILFNREDTEETVLDKISVKNLTFFGSKFGCEPMGTPINDVKIIKGRNAVAKVNFVKKARKKNPVAEIGESYYWWQNYRSPKKFSKTRPTRSMTTNSAFFAEQYDIEDSMLNSIESPDDIADVVSRIEELRDQCEERRENMPEHLQDVGSGELLQERIDNLETWMTELEDIAEQYSEVDELGDEEKQDMLENFHMDASSCQYPG